MAILTADITLKETNAYYGTPVNIHKICVEPVYTRKVSQPKPNALLKRPEFGTTQLREIPRTQKRIKKTPVHAVLNQDIKKEG